MTEANVLALLKGAIEGDRTAHFVAMTSDRQLLPRAQALGLFGPDDPSRWFDVASRFNVPVTDRGRAFYVDANLASLPAGRANQWGHAADRALDILDQINVKES